MLDPIEVTGFALAVAMVICNAKQIQWGWPLAIASSVLYGFVFYKAKLYGDASLQILFVALALWGWLQWRRGTDAMRLMPRSLTIRQAAWSHALWLTLWLLIAWILRCFTDSDAVFSDAFITASSILATLLLARKFTFNWLVWLAVNVVSVVLFMGKQLWLSAVLYSVLAVMSVYGWRQWRRDV